MSKLLIFEVDHNGHRFHYASLLAKEAVARGYNTTLATNFVATKSEEFRCFFSDVASQIHVDDWITGTITGGIKGFSKQLTMLRESIQRAKPDLIFIPYADGLAQAMSVAAKLRLARLPHIPMRGLLFRCSAAYCDSQTTNWTRWKHTGSAMAAVAYPWEKLFHLDEFAIDWYTRRGIRLASMPEPFDTQPDINRVLVRDRIGLPVNAKVIGLFGHLEMRKGIDLLIRAFYDAGVANSILLLAGNTNAQVRTLLDSFEARQLKDRGALLVLDQWLGQQTMMELISAVDTVCAPYPSHVGSASIVLRASACGVQVIGSDFGWIGHTINKYKLGVTVNVRDRSKFSEVIRDTLSGNSEYKIASETIDSVRNLTSSNNFRCRWFDSV
jgi:glycosyltransferase involved in cell wall biosynthesis